MLFVKNEIDTQLDAEIASALEQLAEMDKMSEDYEKLLDRISKLYKLKPEERPKRISPDTVLVVAANLFAIIRLTKFENENVIPSKSALSFIKFPK